MTNETEVIIYPEYIAQIRLRLPCNGFIVSPTLLNEVLVLRQSDTDTRELCSVDKGADGSWRLFDYKSILGGGNAPFITRYDDAGIIDILARIFIERAHLSGHEAMEIMKFLSHSRPTLPPRASSQDIMSQILHKKALPAGDARLRGNS